MDMPDPQAVEEPVALPSSGRRDRSWRKAATADPGPRPARALVLSGGIALGAFEAGAWTALEEAGGPPPD